MAEFAGEIASFIVGLVTGASLKVVWDRSSKDSSRTSTRQRKNKAGGNIAGRDVNIGGGPTDDDR